ncbi:hypothetical protein [Kitasatospora cheerisanensis]
MSSGGPRGAGSRRQGARRHHRRRPRVPRHRPVRRPATTTTASWSPRPFSAGGPEVKAAAQAAMSGPTSGLEPFLKIGLPQGPAARRRHRGPRRHHLSSYLQAIDGNTRPRPPVRGQAAQATPPPAAPPTEAATYAGQAQASATEAANWAAKQPNPPAKRKASADQAAAYAAQARNSAASADAAARSARPLRHRGRRSAAQARQFATDAKRAADDALASKLAAQASAAEAHQAAGRGVQDRPTRRCRTATPPARWSPRPRSSSTNLGRVSYIDCGFPTGELKQEGRQRQEVRRRPAGLHQRRRPPQQLGQQGQLAPRPSGGRRLHHPRSTSRVTRPGRLHPEDLSRTGAEHRRVPRQVHGVDSVPPRQQDARPRSGREPHRHAVQRVPDAVQSATRTLVADLPDDRESSTIGRPHPSWGDFIDCFKNPGLNSSCAWAASNFIPFGTLAESRQGRSRLPLRDRGRRHDDRGGQTRPTGQPRRFQGRHHRQAGS